jgi:hypothetical protein
MDEYSCKTPAIVTSVARTTMEDNKTTQRCLACDHSRARGLQVTFGAIDAKLLNVDSFGFKLVCMQSSSQYLSSLHR